MKHPFLYEKKFLYSKYSNLGDSEIISDLFEDFQTTDGKFSIFEIPADLDPISIISTFALNRNLFGSFGGYGYLIIDSKLFDDFDVPLEYKKAKVDKLIDKQHYRAMVLTGTNLCSFIYGLIDCCVPLTCAKVDIALELQSLLGSGRLSKLNKYWEHEIARLPV